MLLRLVPKISARTILLHYGNSSVVALFLRLTDFWVFPYPKKKKSSVPERLTSCRSLKSSRVKAPSLGSGLCLLFTTRFSDVASRPCPVRAFPRSYVKFKRCSKGYTHKYWIVFCLFCKVRNFYTFSFVLLGREFTGQLFYRFKPQNKHLSLG